MIGYHSYTVNGFGIDTKCLEKTKTKDKINFIKKYSPEKYNDMLDCAPSPNTNNDEFEEYREDWIKNYEGESCEYGFRAIFADAINENEKDFRVECRVGDYNAAVFYIECLPWEMTERERNMSEQDMTNVFKKYLNELHITAPIEVICVEISC